MRIGMLAAAALAVLGPATPSVAADPPAIVFQAHPFGRVLDEFRAAGEVVGGPNGVKVVNRGIKEAFGPKGFDGLDVNRPMVGYVLLAPKPQDITAVVALPVTTEKEFIDLCERANGRKVTPHAKLKDVYDLPPLEPGRGYAALLRFADGYAYIAYGLNPAPAIDPKALVPAFSLYDPAEKGLIAARVHFDRIPADVKLAAPALLGEVKKTVLGGLNIGKQEAEILNPVAAEIDKLLTRYLKLAAGADTLTARLGFDLAAGNLFVEAVLVPKANTDLAGLVGAWKPTTNTFAGLAAAPDTVVAFKTRLPLFEPEIRAAAAGGLEAGAKHAAKTAAQAGKAAVEELFQGLIRTTKKGEFDLAGAVRGPDANGWYTAVGAVAFDDPAALEKELKKYIQADAPKDIQDLITWDAAKAGNVGIHTVKIPGGPMWINPGKVFGGDNTQFAFAFAPHGVFGAIGPDAVATLKDALALKPAPAPVLDVSLNPARMRQLIRKVAPNDPETPQIEAMFGKDDKLASVAAVTVDGGKELTARFTLDLRVLPRLMFQRDIDQAARADEEAEKRPVEKK